MKNILTEIPGSIKKIGWIENWETKDVSGAILSAACDIMQVMQHIYINDLLLAAISTGMMGCIYIIVFLKKNSLFLVFFICSCFVHVPVWLYVINSVYVRVANFRNLMTRTLKVG